MNTQLFYDFGFQANKHLPYDESFLNIPVVKNVSYFACNNNEALTLEYLDLPLGSYCTILELELNGQEVMEYSYHEIAFLDTIDLVVKLRNDTQFYWYRNNNFKSQKVQLKLPNRADVETIFVYSESINFFYDFNQGQSGCIGVKVRSGDKIINSYKLLNK